jgi:hypothetical protein
LKLIPILTAIRGSGFGTTCHGIGLPQFQAQKDAGSAVSGSMEIRTAAQWHFPGNYLEIDPVTRNLPFSGNEKPAQYYYMRETADYDSP